MKFLWFGSKKELNPTEIAEKKFEETLKREEFDIETLKRDRAELEVQQDLVIAQMRRAEEELAGYKRTASASETSESELVVAVTKMEQADDRRVAKEAELNQITLDFQAVSSIISTVERAQAEKAKGNKNWSRMEQETLSEFNTQVGVRTRGRAEKAKSIIDATAKSDVDVNAMRSSKFAKMMEEVKAARSESQ